MKSREVQLQRLSVTSHKNSSNYQTVSRTVTGCQQLGCNWQHAKI